MQNEYVLLTDDSCDLPKSYLDENDIVVMQLSYTIGGKTYQAYDMQPKEFYAMVRGGEMPITAQVNVEQAESCIEPILQQGKDVLCLSFSSALSGTCNSVMVAARELAAKYPERKVLVVDTLCASLGMGLLVYKANALKLAGKPIDEVAGWAEENRHAVCHSFTVDDLMHLHRGGRVSKTSAIVGSMLGIKPLLKVDEEGRLIPINRVRGRKAALEGVVDYLLQCVGTHPNDMFTISHGDCEEDARCVADMIIKRTGVKKHIINYVGPVIGAHSGPGTIAVFMFGEHR